MEMRSGIIPGVAELPEAPTDLAHGEVVLELDRLVPGDRKQGLVPYYHFHILSGDGQRVGHLNFRVGDIAHIRLVAGHIGFRILAAHRGNSYAYQACMAVAPFVRQLISPAILTCNPDNQPSIRTIERLGAVYMDTIQVPVHDPAYHHGVRVKRRYSWSP